MKKKVKILLATFLIIAIAAMLFFLFGFPLLFETYREINLFVIIITLGAIIFCIEKIVSLFNEEDYLKYKN